jgi:hypothetical protein
MAGKYQEFIVTLSNLKAQMVICRRQSISAGAGWLCGPGMTYGLKECPAIYGFGETAAIANGTGNSRPLAWYANPASVHPSAAGKND